MTAPTKTIASTATVKVKADTSQAVAELEKLATAMLRNQPKSGLKSTELYVAAVTGVDNFLLARYGHDWGLSTNLTTVAIIAHDAVSGAYVLARTWLKAQHAKHAAATKASA